MPLHNALPIIILCLPFLACLALPLAGRVGHRQTAWVMIGAAGIDLVLTALLYPTITGGHVLRLSCPWAPELGLNFIFRVDGLSWLFLLLVCGIGLLVAIYAAYYMPREQPLVRFFALLLAFMGAMVGVVTAGNAIQLVFFWELTSLLSFLLIGYWYHGESARDAAYTALAITASGGLCLLAGVLIVGHIVGSYDLDVLLGAGDVVRSSPLYLPALVLILLGALTKSAQFPFHFWLPQAMSAPTPVSAYLHSATLVKLGVFLLLRFWPVLSGTSAWFWLLGGAGLLTLLLGAWFAIFQNDLKGILAYSTISHLGLVAMLLGLGGTLGAVAAIFHTINHATFKASLFMAAGAIDHETGTRDLRRLGGLRHVMPITATLALISGAAMAGVPLLNGFLSKEMFFAVALGVHDNPTLNSIIALLAVLAAAFSVTYSVRLLVTVFFGPVRNDYPRAPHEPPRWMLFPIAFLALACLAVGTLPALVIGPILHNAALPVLGGRMPHYDLMIWHGLSTPLLMSTIAMIIGLGLFACLRRNSFGNKKAPPFHSISGKRLFDYVMVFATDRLPRLQRPFFPAFRLQVQLLLLLLCGGIAAATSSIGMFKGMSLANSPIDPVFVLLWLVGGACALAAATQARFHRLSALMLAGGAGLVVCITFVWFSAPDLAVTQLLVETVTAILILLGLRWLPKRIKTGKPPSRRARYRRCRDLVIAASAGAGLTLLAYVTMLHPVSDTVSRFYLDKALAKGGGHNVVNVILVDFRGFDTMGEITVLAIVALTVFALLRRFRPAPESIGATRKRQRSGMREDPHVSPVADTGYPDMADCLAIPATLITWAAPFMVLFAANLFLRGHDLPGGGFAAGIVVTITLIALYMAHGARWLEARLHIAPVRWISLGLLLALATGAGSIVFGQSFLTAYVHHVDLPILGSIPTNSVLLFDLGVFCVVVGACSLILIALAHQSLRRPLKAAPKTIDKKESQA